MLYSCSGMNQRPTLHCRRCLYTFSFKSHSFRGSRMFTVLPNSNRQCKEAGVMAVENVVLPPQE